MLAPEKQPRTAGLVSLHVLVICLALVCHALPAAAVRQMPDQLGRPIAVPDRPERVVALAPSITEIVFALGQGDRIVGVTQFADFPQKVISLPKVGTYIHLDLERIVALKPDLCIATKDGNPKAVTDRLEAMGIPVYAVDPASLATVLETIARIGDLLNVPARAAALTSRLAQRIRQVDARVAKTADRPGVFFQIGISPIVSVGSGTFIHELIERAGGKNLAAGPTPYPRFSREQVLALAPDVIIITSMARDAVFEKVKAQWQRWPNLPAVRNDRIHLQESNLFDRPTPRLVDGLELLFRLIHPELSGGNP